MKKKTKIIIADDHKVFVDGLKSLLSDEEDILVIGEAYNGIQLVKLVGEVSPDIVITDIDMPEMDGLDAMRIIRVAKPEIKFIILSMHFEFQFVKYAFANGASAFIPKERSSDELINVIYDVINESPENGYTFEVLSDYFQKKKKVALNCNVKLTVIEERILIALAYGNRDKKIADMLNISVHTVDKYKRILKEKTGLRSTLSLALYAIKNGYANLDQA